MMQSDGSSGIQRRQFLCRLAIAGGALAIPTTLLQACTPAPTAAPTSAPAAAATSAPPAAAKPTAAAAAATSAPAAATSAPAAAGPTTAPAVAQGTSISYMAVAEPVSDYILKEMVPPFTKATGIDVQIDTTDYTKLHDKQVLELQSDHYDVFQVDQVWLQSYVKSGFLESLDSHLAKGTAKVNDFFKSLLQVGSMNSSQWVLPLSAIPVDYYYRKDLLDAAGLKPADTWDDLLNIAQKTMTKDASGNVNRWGFATRGEPGNPITWTWLPMLWSFGGQVFDDKMMPVYNSEAGVASVEFFKQLNQTSSPGWHSAQEVAAALQQDQATQTTLMSVYNAAMDDPKDSKVIGKVEFGEMPTKQKRATILGMWTLGLNARSKQKDAAYQFIDYLSTPENAKKMALGGAVGATQPAIYKDPQAPRYFPVLGKVLEYATPPPLIAEADEWFQITGTALQAALSGQKTPKAAMDDAASQVKQLLQNAGYYK